MFFFLLLFSTIIRQVKIYRFHDCDGNCDRCSTKTVTGKPHKRSLLFCCSGHNYCHGYQNGRILTSLIITVPAEQLGSLVSFSCDCFGAGTVVTVTFIKMADLNLSINLRIKLAILDCDDQTWVLTGSGWNYGFSNVDKHHVMVCGVQIIQIPWKTTFFTWTH